MSSAPRLVLALGLEGTLVSNAVSQIPRPGLRAFLDGVRERFGRVVVFSSTTEAKFRHMARGLAAEGAVPEWFVATEFVAWDGPVMSRRWVPGAAPGRFFLLEADEDHVPADERDGWINIPEYAWPYGDDDNALAAAEAELQSRVARFQND